MTWADQLRREVPLELRAQFLTDLQALVASLRDGREPKATDLLHRHPDLALAYLDEGVKKDRARRLLTPS